MSLALPCMKRGLLGWLWTPAVEQLRFRNRVNLKNPLPMHRSRAVMMRLCEPEYPLVKVCKKLEDDKPKDPSIEENQYACYLAKKMKQKFYNHPMIAIYHWNSYTQHEFLKMRGIVFDANYPMELEQRVNIKVMRMALTDTKFDPAIRLIQGPTALGYCKTRDVTGLVQINKKMPAFLLIGVIVDGRLLHTADIVKVADTTLDLARATFSNTLASASGKNLSTTLETNALSLSNNLSSYISSQTKDEPVQASEPTTNPES